MATLFQKNERGREVWMLQVAVPGLGRKTVRLGQAPARTAERFREKVEADSNASLGYRTFRPGT